MSRNMSNQYNNGNRKAGDRKTTHTQKVVLYRQPSVKRGTWTHIPAFSPQRISKDIRRCQVDTSGTYTISQIQLAQLCVGVVATTSTLGFFESNVWRLKKVEIWAGATDLAALPANISAAWPNIPDSTQTLVTSVPNEQSDSTDSLGVLAHLVLRPPGDSAFAGKWWSVTAVSTVLVLVVPQDAIIDFHFDRYRDYVGIRNQCTTALSGATPGTWYAVRSNNMTPLSVNPNL